MAKTRKAMRVGWKLGLLAFLVLGVIEEVQGAPQTVSWLNDVGVKHGQFVGMLIVGVLLFLGLVLFAGPHRVKAWINPSDNTSASAPLLGGQALIDHVKRQPLAPESSVHDLGALGRIGVASEAFKRATSVPNEKLRVARSAALIELKTNLATVKRALESGYWWDCRTVSLRADAWADYHVSVLAPDGSSVGRAILKSAGDSYVLTHELNVICGAVRIWGGAVEPEHVPKLKAARRKLQAAVADLEAGLAT